MSQTLHFKTDFFDLSQEPPNPINPIYGQSLLAWLRRELQGQLEITEPEAEDWGWYSELTFQGCRYLLGSHSEFEAGDDPQQVQTWVFQVIKHRSLTDKIWGKNKQTESDACFFFFKALFERHPRFKEIQSN